MWGRPWAQHHRQPALVVHLQSGRGWGAASTYGPLSPCYVPRSGCGKDRGGISKQLAKGTRRKKHGGRRGQTGTCNADGRRGVGSRRVHRNGIDPCTPSIRTPKEQQNPPILSSYWDLLRCGRCRPLSWGREPAADPLPAGPPACLFQHGRGGWHPLRHPFSDCARRRPR